jgi:hypothetical protein
MCVLDRLLLIRQGAQTFRRHCRRIARALTLACTGSNACGLGGPGASQTPLHAPGTMNSIGRHGARPTRAPLIRFLVTWRGQATSRRHCHRIARALMLACANSNALAVGGPGAPQTPMHAPGTGDLSASMAPGESGQRKTCAGTGSRPAFATSFNLTPARDHVPKRAVSIWRKASLFSTKSAGTSTTLISSNLC